MSQFNQQEAMKMKELGYIKDRRPHNYLGLRIFSKNNVAFYNLRDIPIRVRLVLLSFIPRLNFEIRDCQNFSLKAIIVFQNSK